MSQIDRCFRALSGFSLVELIAALAISGILLSLAVVAVAGARESARRAQCQSRNHQIGVAILTQTERTGYLPSPPKARERYGEPNPWLLLATELEFEALVSEPRNDAPSAFGLCPKVFRCPSDGETGKNYRMSTGSSVSYYAGFQDCFPDPENGPIVCYRTRRLSEVTGGLSQTAIVSERLIGNGRKVEGRSVAGTPPYHMLGPCDELRRDTLERYLRRHWDSLDSYHFAGRNWRREGYVSSLYNHTLTPNDRVAATFHGGGFGPSSYVALFGPSSNHPGGVMVTRLDGSVHFVADTIDGRLWREMGSIR